MSRTNTFRPRVSRADRDRLHDLASELNGAEIESGFQRSLDILLRWFDVILENVNTCPECGKETIDSLAYEQPEKWLELPDGKWRCHYCRTTFTAWDYIGVENRENAEFPIFNSPVRYRFECDHDDHDTSTTSNVVTSPGTNQWFNG